MYPYEHVEELLQKTIEGLQLIVSTDIDAFDAHRLSLLAQKSEELSRAAQMAARELHDKKGHN